MVNALKADCNKLVFVINHLVYSATGAVESTDGCIHEGVKTKLKFSADPGYIKGTGVSCMSVA